VIETGQTLVNPVTGEALRFLQTSRDTGGELVEIECIVQPGGFVAAAHVHPAQEERFRVIEGELSLRAGRERLVLRPARSAPVARLADYGPTYAPTPA